MPRICIFGCRPPGPPITMHRIPNPFRYPDRFIAWVGLIGGTLSESDCAKYKSGRVCDLHFSDRDRTRNRRLNVMAVPSLNLGECDHSQDHVNTGKVHDDHTYVKNEVVDDTKPEIPEDSRSRKSQFKKFASKKNDEEEGKYELAEDSFQDEIVEEYLCEEVVDKDIDDDDLGFSDMDRTAKVDLDVVDELGFYDLDALSYTSTLVNASVTDNGDVKSKRDILKGYSNINKSVKVDEGDDVVLDSGDDDDVVSVKPEDSGGKGDDEGSVPQEHDGFRCNVCLGKIVGFRYRCCECQDYDMCMNCELRGTHPLHFVLRVPGYRIQCDVGRVVAAVRVALAPPVTVKQELVKLEAEDGEGAMADPLDTESTNTSHCDTKATEAKVSRDDANPRLSPSPTRGHPSPPPAKRPRGRGESNKPVGTTTREVIADKCTPELTHPSHRTRARDTEQPEGKVTTDDALPSRELPAPPPAKKPRGRGALIKHGGTSNKPGGTSNKPGGTSNKPGGTSNKPGGTSNKPGGTSNKPGGTPTLKVIADKNTIPVALDALKRQAFIRLENMKLPLQQNISKSAVPLAVISVNRRSTGGKFNTKNKDSSPGIVSKRLSQQSEEKSSGNSQEIALALQNTSADNNTAVKVEPLDEFAVEAIDDEVFDMTEEDFDNLAARENINEDFASYATQAYESL